MANPRNVLVILDFDGTLTKKDTLEHVANVGYQRQARRSPPKVPKPWSEIVNDYLVDYKHHTAQYKPTTSDRKSIAEEVAWLRSLADIERASFNRAIQANIFNNVTSTDTDTYTSVAVKQGSIELRDGWRELFNYLQNQYGEKSLQIVSVNWSTSFIRQVLLEHTRSTPELANSVARIPIFANEILDKPPFVGTAKNLQDIDQFDSSYRIHTSEDKAQIIKLLRQAATTVIYVGDSSTDLECLLEADVGICVRDEPMSSGQRELAGTFERLGIEMHGMGEHGDENMKRREGTRGIFVVKDFVGILKWLKLSRSVV